MSVHVNSNSEQPRLHLLSINEKLAEHGVELEVTNPIRLVNPNQVNFTPDCKGSDSVAHFKRCGELKL